MFQHRISDYASGRDNNFNLLRMLAAFGVLVSHAYPLSSGVSTTQPLETWLQGTTLGTVSVYIFFAISGFFITKSFVSTPSRWQFVAARALRLFPALIVVLILTIIAGVFLTTASAKAYWSEAPLYLVQNATLVKMNYDLPGVFENTPYGPTINGSLWSLFHEVVCYIAVFFAGILGLLRHPKLATIAVVIAILACLLIPYTSSPNRLQLLAKVGLPFALGAGFFIWRAIIPVSPVLGVLLCCLPLMVYNTKAFEPVFVLALSYCTLLFGFYQNTILKMYNQLGDYSYGIYIYAFPVQQGVAHAGITDPLLNIILATPPTLFCAVLSWHIIERPALKLKHRMQHVKQPI